MTTYLQPGSTCRRSRLPGWLRLLIAFASLFALKYALPFLGMRPQMQVLVLLIVASGFAWLFWWNCTPDGRGVAVLLATLWLAGLAKVLLQ